MNVEKFVDQKWGPATPLEPLRGTRTSGRPVEYARFEMAGDGLTPPPSYREGLIQKRLVWREGPR